VLGDRDGHNVSFDAPRETYVYVTLIEIRAIFTTNGNTLSHKHALPVSSFHHDGPANGEYDRDSG